MQGGSDLKAGRTSSSSASSSSSGSSGSSASRTSSSSGAANSAKSAKNLYSLLHFCIITGHCTGTILFLQIRKFHFSYYHSCSFNDVTNLRLFVQTQLGAEEKHLSVSGRPGPGGVRDFTNPILLNKPIFISTSPGICKL